jgi:uncharacterized protein YjbI with pentapeptide repeats
LKFIGYCLPEISFENKPLRQELYFSGATFYGIANFSGTMFSNEVVSFKEANFYDKADFSGANFFNETNYTNFSITVGLSTLFWLLESKPTLETHFL